MAIQTKHILQAIDGQVWVKYEYDDATNRITSLLYANETDSDFEVELETDDRSFRRVIPAQTTGERRLDLPGNARFLLSDLRIRTAWPALGP